MGASTDIVDAWADLVHGSACLGCAMPGRPWCRSCASMVRHRVQARSVEAPGIVAACAGDYEGWIRDLILTHKERSAWSLANPLGVLLAHAVRWAAREEAALVLVPVPSRRSTVRARGHDPTLRMTRVAAGMLRTSGIDARALPLLRLRLPVRDSVGLSAAERRRNLDDAFAVWPPARRALARLQADLQIVVCDDVMTTGATLREAASALALGGIPASSAAVVAVVGRSEKSSQVNTSVNSSARLDSALTSFHGVRPGPWLHRVSNDSASRCQSQAKRST